jgi:hypothetical protein
VFDLHLLEVTRGLPLLQVRQNVVLPDIESQAQKELVSGDACM